MSALVHFPHIPRRNDKRYLARKHKSPHDKLTLEPNSDLVVLECKRLTVAMQYSAMT
jgi:hypothetical protein